MGVQDREWYWEERRRKEKQHYNPKAFRWPRFTPSAALAQLQHPPVARSRWVVACIATIGLLMLVGLWRTHDAETRRMAEEVGLEQKMRLQAAERERLATLEKAARVDRLGQEEAVRQHQVAAQRDLELLGRAAAADDERRRAKRWEGFYKPVPGCERSETVECANAFIRARQQFNELYEREGRRRPGP